MSYVPEYPKLKEPNANSQTHRSCRFRLVITSILRFARSIGIAQHTTLGTTRPFVLILRIERRTKLDEERSELWNSREFAGFGLASSRGLHELER